MAKQRTPRSKESRNLDSEYPTDFTQVEEIAMHDFVRNALTRYGNEVNLERAIPELSDGLKVVHRRVLTTLASYAQGSNVKTANVVGRCLGEYHPHSDTSVADAIETLVNLPVSLVRGIGNWGGLLDGAAAMRYTNCTLSHLGQFVFDKDYMHPSVTSMVPRYDDNGLEPVVLPMRIPYLLMAAPSGIGYGLKSDVPNFQHDYLFDAIRLLIQNGDHVADEPVTDVRDLARNLRLTFCWGGEVVLDTKTQRENYLKFIDSHSATVQVRSVITESFEKKEVIISGFPQGNSAKAVNKIIGGIRQLPLTADCDLKLGTNDTYVAYAKRCSHDSFNDWVDAIEKLTTSNVTYRSMVSIRESSIDDGVVSYRVRNVQATPRQLLVAWIRARVALERRHLAHKVGVVQGQIDHQELLLYCATPANIDIIAQGLKSKEPVAYLMKHLDLTEAEAMVVMELRIRQLSALDIPKTKAKLAELKAFKKQLQVWQKNPEEKVLLDLDEAEQCIQKDHAIRAKADNEVLTVAA